METSTLQKDKILEIWAEHLEVAKSLPQLASAVSTAVDMICDSLAAGGQLLIAGNGGSAEMLSILLRNSPDASCANASLSGHSLCTSTHLR